MRAIHAESCKLWMDWLHSCRYCPAGLPGDCSLLRMYSVSSFLSSFSCYLFFIHFLSFFFFFSLHGVFLTLTLRERETFLSFQGAGGLCPLCLFLCLLLPLLEIHCVSCSPGVTNKISKTYSMPGKGEAYGLYIEADPEAESNGSRLKGTVGLSFLPKGKKATE